MKIRTNDEEVVPTHSWSCPCRAWKQGHFGDFLWFRKQNSDENVSVEAEPECHPQAHYRPENTFGVANEEMHDRLGDHVHKVLPDDVKV